jgi:ParB/RepB/Spo0J family partition protein
MQGIQANIASKNNKRLNKADRQLETATTEILGDIATKLKNSDEDVQEIIDKPDSLLDRETYQKYEKYVGQTVQVPISRICLTNNVRQSIDTEADDFQKLVADIARNGIQQNVIVELVSNEQGGQLVCVAGHRRISAAFHAGNISHVHALIKQFRSKGDRTQSALAENLLRKDLHSIDIAEGYQQLIDDGWTKDDLAEVFERNEKTIRYYLKMAKWPKEVRDIIKSNNDKFSTRLLINKFASKRFPSDSALLKAISQSLDSSSNTKTKKTTSKKKNLASHLEEILEHRKIDPNTRIVIRDVFKDLGLALYE